jgi:uncharacterized membrane protein YqjE
LSNSPGLLASLRGFATTSVALLRTRIELLKVEAQEEIARIAGLLAWAVASVLLGVFGLGFLAIFLTAASLAELRQDEATLAAQRNGNESGT